MPRFGVDADEQRLAVRTAKIGRQTGAAPPKVLATLLMDGVTRGLFDAMFTDSDSMCISEVGGYKLSGLPMLLRPVA